MVPNVKNAGLMLQKLPQVARQMLVLSQQVYKLRFCSDLYFAWFMGFSGAFCHCCVHNKRWATGGALYQVLGNLLEAHASGLLFALFNKMQSRAEDKQQQHAAGWLPALTRHSKSLYWLILSPGFSCLRRGMFRSSYAFQAAFMRLNPVKRGNAAVALHSAHLSSLSKSVKHAWTRAPASQAASPAAPLSYSASVAINSHRAHPVQQPVVYSLLRVLVRFTVSHGESCHGCIQA
jgi:hypothetical protein